MELFYGLGELILVLSGPASGGITEGKRESISNKKKQRKCRVQNGAEPCFAVFATNRPHQC
jgi:hypothetical protein